MTCVVYTIDCCHVNASDAAGFEFDGESATTIERSLLSVSFEAPCELTIFYVVVIMAV